MKDACGAILAGYTAALDSGGEPFVLEERHAWLREAATGDLRDPVAFWDKIGGLQPMPNGVPKTARKALARMLPERDLDFDIFHRPAGMGSLGSETHGGKNYVFLLAACVGYFALINRRIPLKRAYLYVTAFFLGGATLAIADLPGVISPSLNFVFLFFPVNNLESFFNQKDVIAYGDPMSRWLGVPALGGAIYSLMLARYGLRGILEGAKPWRLAVFGFGCFLSMFGGFRSVFIQIAMIFVVLFYLERLHYTRMLLPVVFVSLVASVCCPRAPRFSAVCCARCAVALWCGLCLLAALSLVLAFFRRSRVLCVGCLCLLVLLRRVSSVAVS